MSYVILFDLICSVGYLKFVSYVIFTVAVCSQDFKHIYSCANVVCISYTPHHACNYIIIIIKLYLHKLFKIINIIKFNEIITNHNDIVK